MFEDLGDGIFLVTPVVEGIAEQEDALNAFLRDGDISFEPRLNWAGSADLKVEVISTEDATGNQLAAANFGGSDNDSKTETAVSYITVVVTPVADIPTVDVNGNAAGLEDTKIRVPVRVTLSDTDGSETYTMKIVDNLPATTQLWGASDVSPLAADNGFYFLEIADINNLRVQPPEDWSSPVQGDIILDTITIVRDYLPVLGDDASTTVEEPFQITVKVQGVADKPSSRSIQVIANEDEDYPIGAFVGSLAGVLKDEADGSEALSLVLLGLPGGTVAKTDGSNTGLQYLGGGQWQVQEDAVPNLKVTPRSNYAGDNPYPDLRIRAVAQEKAEGDQINSDDWPIEIFVYPKMDGLNWSPEDSATEMENEVSGRGVMLSNAGIYSLKDSDGSEEVIEFYLDFGTLIEDAKIGKRLNDLLGATDAGLQELVENFLSTTATLDASTGVVTIAANDISEAILDSSLFLDSNENFSFKISALLRETVEIGAETVTETLVQDATFGVRLTGTADVPTVFADDVEGDLTIALNVGGDTTDTDVALERTQSESIHYVMKVKEAEDLEGYIIVDENGSTIGFAGSSTSWLLPKSVLDSVEGDIYWTTLDFRSSNSSETRIATFDLMSIATENDGDRATNATTFSITYTDDIGSGVDPLRPLEPSLIIGNNTGLEDNNLVLDVQAFAAENDPSNPVVSVVFFDFPADAKLKGSGILYDPYTDTYVAPAAVINAGGIKIEPPQHFSGTMELRVEAVAASSIFRTSSGIVELPLFFDPVADSININLLNKKGVENAPVDIPLAFTFVDDDGSEVVDFLYVSLCEQGTLLGNFLTVTADNGQITSETNVAGYYQVPGADAATLQMEPLAFWHGKCSISVVAVTVEQFDDEDSDKRKATTQLFEIEIEAVSSPPAIEGPDQIRGDEDTYIPIVGLSSNLTDTVEDNGFEVLSLVVSGVPEGTLFNYGNPTGDQQWSLPIDQLDKLEIKAPLDYSGTFFLTFTAISLELTSAQEASTSLLIPVVIDPVADDFLILVANQEIDLGTGALIFTNIREMDVRGDLPGENPEETIQLTFFGVSPGVSLSASEGGSITNDEEGVWTFVGTQDQANAIFIAVSNEAPLGAVTITISGITTDSSSVLDSAIEDQFVLTITQPETSPSRQLQPSLPNDEDRNCGSAITIVKDNAAFPLLNNMIEIDDQNSVSVNYRVKHAYSNRIQWIGVLHPEAPVGLSQCPSQVYNFNDEFSLQGNCNDNLSTVIMYLNIEGDDVDNESDLLPNICKNQLPEGIPDGGITYAYEIQVPCLTCSGSSTQRALLSSLDGSQIQPIQYNSPHVEGVAFSKWINYSISNKINRRLQVTDNSEVAGQAAQFELDLSLIGDEEEGSAQSGANTSLMFSVISSALALTLSLLFQ